MLREFKSLQANSLPDFSAEKESQEQAAVAEQSNPTSTAKDILDHISHLQTTMEEVAAGLHSLGEKVTTLGHSFATVSVKISNPSKASNPGNSGTPNIRKSQHVAAESASRAGERPTDKTAFLADFSAKKVQHPSRHYPNIEPTPQSRPNSLIANQAHEPNFGGVTTQYGLQPRLQPLGWFKVYPTFRKKEMEIQTHSADTAGQNSRSSPVINSTFQLRNSAFFLLRISRDHMELAPINGCIIRFFLLPQLRNSIRIQLFK